MFLALKFVFFCYVWMSGMSLVFGFWNLFPLRYDGNIGDVGDVDDVMVIACFWLQFFFSFPYVGDFGDIHLFLDA